MRRHTRIPQNLTPLYARRLGQGSRGQFYLIYFSSLFCLIATGWAATLLF